MVSIAFRLIGFPQPCEIEGEYGDCPEVSIAFRLIGFPQQAAQTNWTGWDWAVSIAFRLIGFPQLKPKIINLTPHSICLHCLSADRVSPTRTSATATGIARFGLHCLSADRVSPTTRFLDVLLHDEYVSIAFRLIGFPQLPMTPLMTVLRGWSPLPFG